MLSTRLNENLIMYFLSKFVTSSYHCWISPGYPGKKVFIFLFLEQKHPFIDNTEINVEECYIFDIV